jgi:hypothetical protein
LENPVSDETNSKLPPELAEVKIEQVDESRRRLAKVGVAGSGVILTLASRSALGGWGTCTGSEMMSGNLSRPGEANPCGCSPGYWGNRNGRATWAAQTGKLINSNHSQTALFKDVFVEYFVDPDTTLLQAVRKEKKPKDLCGKSEGFLQTAAFHAVAALLNASVYGSRYPVPPGYQTPSGVINSFKSAVASCDLETFVNTVDVYTSSSTWCFGDSHHGDN